MMWRMGRAMIQSKEGGENYLTDFRRVSLSLSEHSTPSHTSLNSILTFDLNSFLIPPHSASVFPVVGHEKQIEKQQSMW